MSACARPGRATPTKAAALLLDAPTPNRWPSLLALAEALVGRLDWWPRPPADAGSSIVGALAGRQAPDRGQARSAAVALRRRGNDAAAHAAEKTRSGAGATAARTGTCSIAAHAHADALSVEVRYAGVDILADPGTYCYHGERAWRSYFRSTIAHNTAELGGRSQSSEGGPFMWVRHAQAREIEVHRRRRHRQMDRGARRLRLA